MKKRFKIYDKDGNKYKCRAGEMLVMNSEGVFFLVSGLNDYYTSVRKLSEKIGNYDVKWGIEE